MNIDSFILLARPWSSLPMMLKLSGVVLCPVWVICMWMGEGSLRCSLNLSKGPGGFPYVFLITCKFPTLVVIYRSTLLVHGILVFGPNLYLFSGPVPLEKSLDTIFTASLLDTFPQSLCVRNNYVTFAVFFLVVPLCGVTAGVAGSFWVFPLGVTVFSVVEDIPFLLVQCPLSVLALGQHSPKVL